MKLADVETLVGEVADQAYEKACEIVKSAKATVQKVTDSLQEPEYRQKNLEQVREKARESIKDRLARGKTEADRLNRERMERRDRSAMMPFVPAVIHVTELERIRI